MNKTRKLLLPLLVLLGFILIVAALGWWDRDNQQVSPLPSPTIPGAPLPEPGFPGMDDDPTQPPANGGVSCGIEQCHGLEVTCGPDVPMACTLEYRLGDFCRQYIDCTVIEGECQRVDQPQFIACQTCVEACIDGEDPMGAFECEERCRQQM